MGVTKRKSETGRSRAMDTPPGSKSTCKPKPTEATYKAQAQQHIQNLRPSPSLRRNPNHHPCDPHRSQPSTMQTSNRPHLSCTTSDQAQMPAHRLANPSSAIPPRAKADQPSPPSPAKASSSTAHAKTSRASGSTSPHAYKFAPERRSSQPKAGCAIARSKTAK